VYVLCSLQMHFSYLNEYVFCIHIVQLVDRSVVILSMFGILDCNTSFAYLDWTVYNKAVHLLGCFVWFSRSSVHSG